MAKKKTPDFIEEYIKVTLEYNTAATEAALKLALISGELGVVVIYDNNGALVRAAPSSLVPYGHIYVFTAKHGLIVTPDAKVHEVDKL